MEHKERSNKNRKFFKYIAVGIGCLLISVAGIIGGKYYYERIHDPIAAPKITMMSLARKDVETHTPVSHIVFLVKSLQNIICSKYF